MKTCSIKSQVSPFLPIPTQPKISPKFSHLSHITCAHNNNGHYFDSKSCASAKLKMKYMEKKKSHEAKEDDDGQKANSYDDSSSSDDSLKLRRSLVVGGAAFSVGLAVLLMTDKAWAFGPEGPLLEEFWENVRRYGLYALTVSTGVLYSVFQPIYELLKNPISAVLVVIIIGGSFFIVSQILSAMVGVSDFNYEYAY